MRHPNKLRTQKEEVFTINEAKFEPLTPESVAASYGNDIGCILRDTVSINETSLRDPSRDHLQVLLIQKLHDRFKFPKPYHDKNDLTTNMVNKKALSKFTQALNSWKGRLRRMIREGKDYPEVSMKYPQITEEEWTTFKKTASLPEVEEARKWGIGMRGLNIGPHFLGSRGYGRKKAVRWNKEDAERKVGEKQPWDDLEDGPEKDFVRAHYKTDSSGNLVTSNKMKDLQNKLIVTLYRLCL